jgi:hypothetical protein
LILILDLGNVGHDLFIDCATIPAIVNAVEAGITEVWNLLVSGRLKVMASLTNWTREFRKYDAMTTDRGRSSSGTTT